MCRKGACLRLAFLFRTWLNVRITLYGHILYLIFLLKGIVFMYQALYRKYRSKTFDDLYGQDHISTVLQKQCDQGNFSHAYLFCGTRGTGKTSSAKIFSKAVNCENPINGNPCGVCSSCREIDSGTATDVLEIDAASNNGVDNIRDLREEVAYPPTYLKKRVYIIDEVHMLTESAFNALLKTLEEPPEYVLFILCTTELNKIPPTILSRCQRYEFKRIDIDTLKKRLFYICEKENIILEDEAASLLAKMADGGMRDAISMLESCIASAERNIVTKDAVERQLGISDCQQILDMFESLSKSDISTSLSILNQVHYSSKNLLVFLEDMILLTRDLIIASGIGKYDNVSFFFTKDEMNRFVNLSKTISVERLMYFSSVLEDVFYKTSRHSQNARIMIEIALVKLGDPRLENSINALTARLSNLERRVATGNFKSANTNAENDLSSSKPLDNIILKSEKIQENNNDPSDDVEEVFENFSEFLNELNHDQRLKAFLSDCEMTQKGHTVFIHCNLFKKSILSSKSDFSQLCDALKRCSGEEYKLVLTDEKTSTKKEKIDEIFQ